MLELGLVFDLCLKFRDWTRAITISVGIGLWV